MATSYSFQTTTAANTAVITSTRVKVVANNACYYAISTLASANVGPMIPANRPTDINMITNGNIGGFLSVVPVGGAATAITVTQIGTVNASGFVGAGGRYYTS